MKTYKVRAYNIDYCVEDEDVCSEFADNDVTIEEINKRIAQIKSELPQDMVFDIECEEGNTDELEELLTDAISNETGWLIVGYDYDIL